MPLTLSQRPGSRLWQITGVVAGHRVRQSAGTTDRRLAEEKRAHIEATLFRQAVYGARAVVTWEQAVASYVEVTDPSPSTQAYLLRLLEHFGPGCKLLAIDQVAIDQAIRVVCRPGVSASTKLRAVITPVRAVLSHSARRGWCDAPAFETPPGASGAKRTRWLTPDEYNRLRHAAPAHLRTLIVFMASTGARISEALALDWCDVDLAHASATLREVKSQHGHSRDRTCLLLPAALAALAASTYPVLDGGRVVRRGGKVVYAASRKGAVFRTDDGLPYRTFGQEVADWGGQIRTAWGGACRAAGFAGAWHKGASGHRWWSPQDVTPHVLRHTWASWHYAVHRDLLRLRDDGLWSSVTLAERYAKLVPSQMVPAILEAWGQRQELTQARNRKLLTR